MGAILARAMAGTPLPSGGLGGSATLALSGATRAAVAGALHQVFLAGTATSVAALIVTFFLPPVSFERPVPSGTGEQMIAAEMSTLEPDDEPVGVAD